MRWIETPFVLHAVWRFGHRRADAWPYGRLGPCTNPLPPTERAKVRRATASTLLTTTMKIITSVNTYKDHIPPITMQGDANPFPYAITVNQRNETGGGGMMRGFF